MVKLIDDEIVSERRMANYYKDNNLNKEAREHERRAEWLEELKCYKNDNDFSEYADRLHKIAFHSGYNKALDDFAERLSEYLNVKNTTKYGNENAEQQINSYDTLMKYEIADAIEDVAEQLKAGGKNE